METEDDLKPKKGHSRRLARSIIKHLGIKAAPVLLKDISKFIPELTIDGAEMADGISGLQVTYKGHIFIRYNSLQSRTRNRFTVAHEIGHALLGHTAPCDNRIGTRSINEVEANQFAAELLMPLALLKEAIPYTTNVDTLALKFWVSKDAMWKRIMETGLFKKIKI